MREVDDPRDTEDQRQPGADQEQRRAEGESGEKLTEDEVHDLGRAASGRYFIASAGRRLLTSASVGR